MRSSAAATRTHSQKRVAAAAIAYLTDMRFRREHVVGMLLLAWSAPARAADEDVVVARASRDLQCDDLRVMHSSNQYAVTGCGHTRKYECANGACADVTNLRTGAPDPSAACVAEAIGATTLVGCACLGAITSKSPPAPNMLPQGGLDACR